MSFTVRDSDGNIKNIKKTGIHISLRQTKNSYCLVVKSHDGKATSMGIWSSGVDKATLICVVDGEAPYFDSGTYDDMLLSMQGLPASQPSKEKQSKNKKVKIKN